MMPMSPTDLMIPIRDVCHDAGHVELTLSLDVQVIISKDLDTELLDSEDVLRAQDGDTADLAEARG